MEIRRGTDDRSVGWRAARAAFCLGFMLAAASPIDAGEAADSSAWSESCAAADAASVGGIKFSIVEATDPQAYPAERGTLDLLRVSDDHPVCLTWRYGDGSDRRGLGLSLSGAGALAAAFGDGIRGIHLYRRDGSLMEGVEVAASPEASASPVTMAESDRLGVYDIEGGGRFVVSRFRGEIANVTWHMPDGDISGMAIEHGAFLAAIAIDPSSFNGIALYVASPDGSRATGRWTAKGAWGIGTETLEPTRSSSGQSDFFAPP